MLHLQCWLDRSKVWVSVHNYIAFPCPCFHQLLQYIFSMEDTITIMILTINFIMCLFLYKFDVQDDFNFPACQLLYFGAVLRLPVNYYTHWKPRVYPVTPPPIPTWDTLLNIDDIRRGNNIWTDLAYSFYKPILQCPPPCLMCHFRWALLILITESYTPP